jgi:predicted ABC-type sugar transport system permease subunit
MSALGRLKSWEGLLLALLIAIVVMNVLRSPYYLGVSNIVNLFQLSIEKIIVALIMTLIIINGEIDLSVASVMGLAACVLAWLFQMGTPVPVAIAAALLSGLAAGLFNGFWIAYVGLPSLAFAASPASSSRIVPSAVFRCGSTRSASSRCLARSPSPSPSSRRCSRRSPSCCTARRSDAWST